MCFLCEGERGARCWFRPDMGRLSPRIGSLRPSERASAFPGNVKARADGLSLGGSPFAPLSPSPGFIIFDGLVMPVVLAVAVCAVLAMLPRLVTLAGLFSDFSSNCIGLATDIAFAAASIPSLIVVVAAGASCCLLEAEMSADITLCPGFSPGAFPDAFACSCRLRSSSTGPAPGEARGDTLVPKRGDLASGEAVSPASAMAPTVAEFGDESSRLRFNGRAVDWSGVGGVLATSCGGCGGGAESGMFLMSAVGAVGADTWSDSMRANAKGSGWKGVDSRV